MCFLRVLNFKFFNKQKAEVLMHYRRTLGRKTKEIFLFDSKGPSGKPVQISLSLILFLFIKMLCITNA